MLRHIVPSRKTRRKNAVKSSRITQTETPLEIRRVLSAVSVASVDDVQHESVSQSSAEARIVNGAATNEYKAVGIVNGGCTGTLISPDTVLTAAHCVESGNGFIGDTEGTFTVNGQTYQTSKVTVHPNYNINDFGAGYDIAIMKLNRPVEGVTPYDINRATPQVGQMLTLVGFGETGSSTSGSNGDFGNKQVGQTQIDSVTATHINWNFDSHNESNTAPGDSGGPAFLNVNGQLVIAGITSGGEGDAHSLGDFSFDTRVDTLASWIDQVAGQTGGGGGNDGGGGDNGGGGNDGGGGGDTGGSGTTTGEFSSTSVVAIPDNQVATVSSTAVASGMTGTITDVNVTLDIRHTWNEDLTVTLISPSGTRIELFDGVGGDSSNFRNTTLDDQAGDNIENGSAPFRGTFRPTGSLALLNGEHPNGSWTLEVQDNFDLDGGRIRNFTVSITTDGATDSGGSGGDTGGSGGGGGGGGGGGDTGGNDGDTGGGGDDGSTDGSSLHYLAISVDNEYDLDTTGNYFEDWGGQGEKWMFGNTGWVYITPDGSLYEWTGDMANGNLIATLSPAYHTTPEMLHDAINHSGPADDPVVDPSADSQAAIDIDQQYDLDTTGNLYENWAGQGEKWLYGNTGWFFITPDGSLFQFAGNDDGSDRLIHQFSADYHADVSLLYNAYDNSLQRSSDEDATDDLFAAVGEGSCSF